MIPAKVNLCSAWVSKFNISQNDSLLVECLDLLEEYWEVATIRLTEYQQKLARRFNQDIRVREFNARDLVLRKAVGNMRDTNARKLAQTWEGPYRITAIAGAGAYYLEDMDETPLPRPWNIHNLKKFYQWSSIHKKMYLVLTNMITMMLIHAGSINSIIYLAQPINEHEGIRENSSSLLCSKDWNLLLDSIPITGQVETFF